VRFQPNSGVTDASTVQAFDQVSRVLDATTRVPAFGFLTAAVVQVSAGEFKRLAPRAAGQTVVLPEASAINAGLSVFLLVNGLGTLTVKPVSGTVNGSASAAFAAGAYAVELTSDGEGRWLTRTIPDGSVTTAKLAADAVSNAKLTDMAAATVKGRALGAGTGNPTDLTGAQVVDIIEPEAATWTATHKFSGELRLGTLHTEANVSGAFNITLTAGASRILITSTAAATLGTISGAVDGRVCVIEHVRASGAGDLTLTHSLADNGIACQGSANLTLTGNRSGCWLVCRDAVWRVIAHTN
jgi:hypothetical protein